MKTTNLLNNKVLAVTTVILAALMLIQFAASAQTYANDQANIKSAGCASCNILNPANAVDTSSTTFTTLDISFGDSTGYVTQNEIFPAEAAANHFIVFIVKGANNEILDSVNLSNVEITTFKGGVSNNDTKTLPGMWIKQASDSTYGLEIYTDFNFDEVQIKLKKGNAGNISKLDIYSVYYSAWALPIELVYFSAELGNNASVQLDWATASEVNNSYFEVERSTNGKEFTSINNQSGAGNSSSLRNYSFTDEAPLSGVSYYRLKQVDFDGKFTYSNLITVTIKNEGTFNVSSSAGRIVIAAQGLTDKQVAIAMYDMSGRKVYENIQEAMEGNFSGNIDNTESFTKGIYSVVMTTATQQFAKQVFVN